MADQIYHLYPLEQLSVGVIQFLFCIMIYLTFIRSPFSIPFFHGVFLIYEYLPSPISPIFLRFKCKYEPRIRLGPDYSVLHIVLIMRQFNVK